MSDPVRFGEFVGKLASKKAPMTHSSDETERRLSEIETVLTNMMEGHSDDEHFYLGFESRRVRVGSIRWLLSLVHSLQNEVLIWQGATRSTNAFRDSTEQACAALRDERDRLQAQVL